MKIQNSLIIRSFLKTYNFT